MTDREGVYSPQTSELKAWGAKMEEALADLDRRPTIAGRLKSWLARRVAGLIARDPEAARIVAEAVRRAKDPISPAPVADGRAAHSFGVPPSASPSRHSGRVQMQPAIRPAASARRDAI